MRQFLPVPCLQPPVCILSVWISVFGTLPVNGLSLYINVSDSFTLHSIWRFIHIVTFVSTSFLFVAELYGHRPQSVYPFIGGWWTFGLLPFFWLLWIVLLWNILCVRIWGPVFESCGYMPGSEIAGLYGNSNSLSWRATKLFSIVNVWISTEKHVRTHPVPVTLWCGE